MILATVTDDDFLSHISLLTDTDDNTDTKDNTNTDDNNNDANNKSKTQTLTLYVRLSRRKEGRKERQTMDGQMDRWIDESIILIDSLKSIW